MARHRHLLPPYALNYAQVVASKIRDTRNAKKLTQFRLAALAGIHQMTLKRIEECESIPDIAELKIIADALHVSVVQLTDDTHLALVDEPGDT